MSHGSGVNKNVIIFGVDISSSVHIAEKKKDIVILGKSPTDGLDHTMVTAKKNVTCEENNCLFFTSCNCIIYIYLSNFHFIGNYMIIFTSCLFC